MNTQARVGALLIIGLSFTIARTGASQDPGQGEGFDPAAMMEAMKLAQPGAEHEWLSKMSGEWETVASLAMMPGADPLTSKGTASSRTILGGRFLEVISSGNFMGQEFESRSILGFDRRHEEYTIIGLDTLGTYWVTGQGKRDADGVIRMRGEDDDPSGKQVYTFEYEIISDDVYEFRVVFEQIGPQEFDPPHTMVTVRSTRKKD